MSPASTHFVLGYHGCDRRVAERVFAGKDVVTASNNDWDWLGEGVYFWEANAQRAFDYATELANRRRSRKQRIVRPAVIGAVIDLGFCLNLMDSASIVLLRDAYLHLQRVSEAAGLPVPQNTGGPDRLNRKLDCAVMRTLHLLRQDAKEAAFDTVRAAFIEGESVYPGAGFAEKTHLQICVRDMTCIKGYFRPLADDGRPATFA